MDQQRQVVKFPAESASLVGDSSREHIHPKTKCAQQQREQTIQFIAESTAVVFNDLRPQGWFIENDFSSQGDSQIFKRHSQQMGLVQSLQGLQGRFK